MNSPSLPVRSSQSTTHPRLEATVRRHLEHPWKQPLHAPTVAAFERLLALPGLRPDRGLIFDSGCGTGASSQMIATRHPQAQVIGIDRSLSRLSRLGECEFPLVRDNVIWLHAELSSFWRLALQCGWRLERHYLLYPNPWPKPGQLKRRWHAHPVFPQLLALCGVLEMRSNWAIFAQEFKCAAGQVCPDADIRVESALSEQCWGDVETPFGRKYAASGHILYRVVADLTRTAV